MIRYLVCSDIHGREDLFSKMLEEEKDIDALVIAGDLELDIDRLSEVVMRNHAGCKIYAVAGNCDAYGPLKGRLREVLTFPLGDRHRVFLTHGHIYRARSDLMGYSAMENGCNIVIFGHTHCVCVEDQGDILFLNPGALKSGSYMMLEENEGRLRAIPEML